MGSFGGDLFFEVAGELGFELVAELCKGKGVGNWDPILFSFKTIISSVSGGECAMDMVVTIGRKSLPAVDLAGKVGSDGFFLVVASEGFERPTIEIAASKG